MLPRENTDRSVGRVYASYHAQTTNVLGNKRTKHGVRDPLPAASISSRTAPPECDSSPVLPITTLENDVLQCSTETIDVLGTVHNSFDGAWKEIHVMLHFFTIPRMTTFYNEGETKAKHVLVCHGDHVATTTESSVILVGEVVI